MVNAQILRNVFFAIYHHLRSCFTLFVPELLCVKWILSLCPKPATEATKPRGLRRWKWWVDDSHELCFTSNTFTVFNQTAAPQLRTFRLAALLLLYSCLTVSKSPAEDAFYFWQLEVFCEYYRSHFRIFVFPFTDSLVKPSASWVLKFCDLFFFFTTALLCFLQSCNTDLKNHISTA